MLGARTGSHLNCRAAWRVGANHAPFAPPQKPQIGGKCYVSPDRARHPIEPRSMRAALDPLQTACKNEEPPVHRCFLSVFLLFTLLGGVAPRIEKAAATQIAQAGNAEAQRQAEEGTTPPRGGGSARPRRGGPAPTGGAGAAAPGGGGAAPAVGRGSAPPKGGGSPRPRRGGSA